MGGGRAAEQSQEETGEQRQKAVLPMFLHDWVWEEGNEEQVINLLAFGSRDGFMWLALIWPWLVMSPSGTVRINSLASGLLPIVNEPKQP